MLPTKKFLKYRDIEKLEIKRQKNIYHVNTAQMKANIAILIKKRK